ncbi:hypothetical protein LCGC14_2629940, partial [marine sediment metagenome]
GDAPFGGSESIKAFLRWTGIPEAEGNSLARGFGQGVASAIPFVGLTGLAARGRAAAVAISPESRTVIQNSVLNKLNELRKGAANLPGAVRGAGAEVVRAARANPASAASLEALSGGFSGSGAELAGQASEGLGLEQGGTSDQFLRMTGGVLGGITPAVGVGALRGAGQVIKAGRRALDPETAATDLQKGTNRVAGERLREAIPGESLGDVPFQEINLTTAQALQHPGLISLEKTLVSQGPIGVKMAEEMGRMRSQNNRAIRNLIETVEPPNVSSDVAIKSLQGRLDKANRAVDDRIKNLMDGVETQVARTGNPADRSEAARVILEAGEQEFKVNAGVVYDRVQDEAERVSFRPFMTKVNARVRKITDEFDRFTDMDDVPVNHITKIDEINADPNFLKGSVSYHELRTLKKNISRDIRAEEAQVSPNRELIRRLNILHDGVIETLDDVALQSSELGR